MLDPTPYRRLFPLTDRFVFLNHAGVSPLNTRAVEAMHAFIERTMTEPFDSCRVKMNPFGEVNTSDSGIARPLDVVACPVYAPGRPVISTVPVVG